MWICNICVKQTNKTTFAHWRGQTQCRPGENERPDSHTLVLDSLSYWRGPGLWSHGDWWARTGGAWSTSPAGPGWRGIDRGLVQEDVVATSPTGPGWPEQQQGCQLPWMTLLQKRLKSWAHNFPKNKQTNQQRVSRVAYGGGCWGTRWFILKTAK